jgi:hypothetical protein
MVKRVIKVRRRRNFKPENGKEDGDDRGFTKRLFENMTAPPFCNEPCKYCIGRCCIRPATLLPYPFLGFRPVALRPTFSGGLPFPGFKYFFRIR